MDLHVTSDADIAELDSLIPADLSVKRLGGGRAAVTYGDMAKIVFPLLDIAPEVAPLTVGASFFSVEAWSRWWEVLHSFMAPRRGRQDEYPAYMHAALVARAAATDAQRAALTVVPTDLEATEDTRPGAADGAAAPVDTRGFFMHLTYGSMRSQHGLMSLARLTHGLGCHAAHCARATTGFRRGMRVLAQFAAAVTGLPAADMEPQEVADVLATELNAIAWGTEFEHLGSHLSDVKWSQLRLELTLGRPEEWSKAATRARLLSERFHGVVGMPRFKAVAAVVRGTEAAAGRSLTSPGACALAEEIAVRAGVLRPGEPFTSDVLAMLTSKVGHMTEALLAQPWVSRTPRERAEHVVELLRNSEANLAAADALRHQIGDPIVSKDKSELRGQGTIPKHFQAHVGPAMMSGPYRDLKAAALARLAQGDPAAELDALQTISTGVIVQPDGTILPRQWSALAMMIADGPKHGVNAELFDEEAAVLTARLSRVSCRVLALLYFVKWLGARGALCMWSSGGCSDLQRTAVAASVDPLCGNKTFLALDCLDWWPL
ncbi:hypothetical protein AB1Y20_002228 [Prymnesium parvum]|uniref:Uncharacterized protein n=1 Tax=Prymnesium parvum TaxID=97485 RepID=A0AB34J8I6_PRYPA